MSDENVKSVEENVPKIDFIIDKIVSRKLFVWVVSTVLMCTGTISTTEWLIVTGGFLGTQGLIDAVTMLKGGKK